MKIIKKPFPAEFCGVKSIVVNDQKIINSAYKKKEKIEVATFSPISQSTAQVFQELFEKI